jgi:predicted hydrocarbon binding protein
LGVHGIIHLELARFVIAGFGADAWPALLKKAGLGSRIYTAAQAFPDDDITRLVGAAVEMTGKPAEEILEAFGAFLVPVILTRFGSLVRASWRTLDVIEHTEETIHRVIRLREPSAAPPRLRVERTRPDQAILRYDSPRRLCAVARGIMRGVARHFDEPIALDERTCMHRGDAECEIVISLQPRV